MRQSAVNEWLNDEVVSFYDSTSLVDLSSPDKHVGMASERDEDSTIYPFIGIRKIASTPISAGIGNQEVFVDSLNYDDDDALQSIDYRRQTIYRVELVPVTDGDMKLRDDLYDDLADHFALLARRKDYHEDIEDITVDEATSQSRPENFVYADGIPLDIEYKRLIEDVDVTAAETVNLDIDVSDDTDVTTDDDTDPNAFDESVS